jgi:hypothetical protein
VLLAGRTETEGAPGPVVFEPAPEVFR